MRSSHVALAASLAFIAGACSDVNAPATTSSTIPVAASAPSFALVGGTGATAQIASTWATGKCIDVTGISRTSGTQLQIWSCSGGINQQWTWLSDGTIRVYSNSMCIDVASNSGDGSPVVVNTCNGASTQQWAATSANEIKSRYNSKCIDITNVGSSDGSKLQLWTCSGGKNQKWANDGATTSAPAPTPTTTLTGLPIYPGQSIQAAVNANPSGTTFLIKSGTYAGQTVVPKEGDVFNAEAGAILDGQNATAYAFRGRGSSGWVNNVTIRGLKITGYRPPSQDGAVSAGYGPTDGSSGWLVENNEISYNGQYGIRIGNAMRVLNNNVHHNEVINISGAGDNTTVEGNEIAFGNYLNNNNANYEAGGTKFVITNGLVLRNNYVHDNVGPGLWTDTDNINVLIEGNRVENNGSEGIVHEIGYNAIIRYNTVTGNGWADPRKRYWLWNAGIGIHSSPDVEVYGNTVGNNMNGIVGIQQNRGSGRYGAYVVQNLYVHDNKVTQTTLPPPYQPSAAGGLAQDNGDNTVFTSRNNRWVNNTYWFGANGHPFEWLGSWRTEYEWQGLGQDLTGTFYR